MDSLIKTLAEAWGPSGFEHRVRDLIRAEVEPLADEVRVDPLGNLICRIGSGPKRIMTAAHMDEIGLIVSHIDRLGYARFAQIGALYPAALLGSRVQFENGQIGVIGADDQHARKRELPGLGGFFIDVDGVQVGDPAVFVGETIRRGNRLIGKALDDRLGCAIQIEAMRRIRDTGTPHTIYFAFTVQEEVGTRGAEPAAYGIAPDFGLALDVSPTGDQPHGRPIAIRLGGGAAIKARDMSLITPPAVKDLMIRRAEEAGIPYQIEVLTGGGTDAKVIQVAHSGVPTGAILVPVRHVHTPGETVDRGDMQAALSLLVAVLSQEITV